MRPLIVLCTVALAAGSLTAQAPPASPMRQLDWLVGEWHGRGNMMIGPGRQHDASVVERAESHAGGHALTLNGLGKALQGRDSIVVHSAFAVIWHDAEAARFRIKAFRATGHTIDADITVGEGSIVWGFDDPRAGRVRFTVTRTPEGRWHEIGEASRDSATWMKFFEMALEKTGRNGGTAERR